MVPPGHSNNADMANGMGGVAASHEAAIHRVHDTALVLSKILPRFRPWRSLNNSKETGGATGKGTASRIGRTP
jgi:hypothetical protein